MRSLAPARHLTQCTCAAMDHFRPLMAPPLLFLPRRGVLAPPCDVSLFRGLRNTSCYQPLSDTFRSRDDFRSLRPAVGLPPLRRLLVSHISPFSRGGTCNNTRFPPPRSRSRPTPEWNSSRSGSTRQWLFKQVGWVCRARFCSLHSPQTEVPCGRSRPFSVRRLLLGCKFVTPV